MYVKVVPTNKSFRPHLPTLFGKALTWSEEDNIFPYSSEVERLVASKQITTIAASDAEVAEHERRHGFGSVSPEPPKKKRGGRGDSAPATSPEVPDAAEAPAAPEAPNTQVEEAEQDAE